MPETPIVDAGLEPIDPDMGTAVMDTSFVPTTFDQGNPPPQFELDFGVDGSDGSNTDSGCGCSQQRSSPLSIWFMLMLFTVLLRRRVY